MPDIPEYVIRPKAIKITISQFTITAFLAALFYTGVAINISLLGMRIPLNIKLLIAAILGLLVIVQCLLTFIQASKTQYLVFKNRIQLDSKYFMFNSIPELKKKRDFFDSLFGTGTIVIDPKTRLKGIPNFEQNFNYLQQLIQYSKTQFTQQ